MKGETARTAAETAQHAGWPLTIGLLFVLGLAFGIVYTINLTATGDGVPFIPYVFWQSLGAAGIVLLLCAAFRSWPKLRWTHVRLYALTGLLNLAIPYSILAYVAPKVPSGVLALTVTLVPILVYALALAFRIDRLRLARLIGLLLGFAGVLLVLLPRASLPEPEMAGWVALALVVPFCYALNAVLIALMSPPATGALPLGFGLLFSSAVYSGIAMAVTGEFWAFPAPFSPADWATMAAMANNALTYVLIFVVIHRAGPVVFSTSNYIATLAGIGFGIWIFGDRPSVWIWAALVLMCAGLFLVNFSGVRLRRKAA